MLSSVLTSYLCLVNERKVKESARVADLLSDKDLGIQIYRVDDKREKEKGLWIIEKNRVLPPL